MEIKVKILNRLGLHARPAALIAQCANKFSADILLSRDADNRADAKSILSLLMLGAPCGAEITIAASGADADDAVQAVANLFESKFDEE